MEKSLIYCKKYHLHFTQFQSWCYLGPLCEAQVLLRVELPLQLQQLFRREGSSSSSRFVFSWCVRVFLVRFWFVSYKYIFVLSIFKLSIHILYIKATLFKYFNTLNYKTKLRLPLHPYTYMHRSLKLRKGFWGNYILNR